MNKYDNRYNSEREIIKRMKTRRQQLRNLILLALIMIILYGCIAVVTVSK